MIVMDVNNLKPTNDRYGHQAGDKLIRRTAEVLRAGTAEGLHHRADRRGRVRCHHAWG